MKQQLTWSRGCGWLLLAVLLSLPVGAFSGVVSIAGPFGRFNVHPKSLPEMRWDTVVRQQYDFSCGSAAVATLLTYHYERPTSENQVFQSMIASGNRQKIQAQGFSMLDMKRYLDSQGLHSDGFKMPLDAFLKIGVPGITLVNTGGFKHFVVVKGLDDDRVLVGDPAIGVVVVPRRHFESIWSGAVLAARADMQIARRYFNSQQDWRIRPRAPVGRGHNGHGGIGTMVLTLPGANEMGR